MKVDMSPEAVEIRLKQTSQLRRLCLELGKMKPVAPAMTEGAGNAAKDPKCPAEYGDQPGNPKPRRFK